MKRLLFATILSFCCMVSFAAGKQIKGVLISSEDKAPLIGASVYILPEDLKKVGYGRPSLGVTTDIDGNYIITIPEKITRFFCSYVGHVTKEVKLTDKTTYNVTLEPSQTMLDAVVVTGYQTIERRKLTASVSKLDISDSKIGMIRSVDQALSGQIAGLSAVATSGAPGAPVKIRIRGTASLNGTQDPLWVLDGIPMEGTDIPKMEDLKDIDNVYSSSIAGLNPADIANITVLKDAAATAIYGARAANGVIVITTKSGQKGKAVINFSTKMTYSPRPDISRLNLLNSQEKVGLELDLLRSNYTFRDNKGDVSRIIARNGLTNNYISNGWNGLNASTQNEILRLKSINTDWNDILFRPTFNQEYNLSLSGGNDHATYYTSLGYYDERGNTVGVESNRFNIVAKTSYKVNKILKVGASLFANQRKNNSYLTDNDGFTNPNYYSRRANPYMLPYNDLGEYNYDTDIQGKGDSDLMFNIFEERANTSNENISRSLSTNFDAELRFNDQFKITSQLGIQSDITSIEKIADKNSYAMRKDMERSIFKYSDNVKRPFLPDGGVHKENENRASQTTWKAMAEYRNSFNNIHEFETMLGTEVRKTFYQTLYSAGYGFNRQTLTTRPVIFPNDEQARYFPLHLKTYTENAYVSAFSTISYSFKHRYTVGGSIRFDGSDVFGVDKKYRYLPLYSVSALWRLSNEPFMKDIKAIDNWVFRASYGLQGNIDKNTSPFVMGTYRVIEMLPGKSENMIDVSSPPNTKLRWEKTQSVNFGTDISLFEQAITLSADAYYRKSTDLIGMQMLPLESGFISTTVNWASLSNKGIEVALGTRNIRTKDFSWFTNFNIGYNNNEVLRESTPANQTTPERVGHSVGALFAYKSAGLDNEGYPLFYNKAGEKVTAMELFKLTKKGNSTISELTAEEQRNLYSYIGSSEPLFSGGLTNTFTYKNFELGINCIFNLGFYVKTTPSYSLTSFDRGMNANKDILNRWTPTNTNTSFPTLITKDKRQEEFSWFDDFKIYEQMDTWIKRGDYLRVQSIRLGYELPKSIAKFLHIESGKVSAEGRNFFVIGSNYKNYLDPETMGNQFAQPIPKSVTFSLNVKF